MRTHGIRKRKGLKSRYKHPKRLKTHRGGLKR